LTLFSHLAWPCGTLFFGFSHWAEHVSDLVYAVERLNSMVNAAKVDLESFKAREARHRQTAHSNRRRVTFWAVTECLLVLAVAVAQVVRIRNFFEFKRIV